MPARSNETEVLLFTAPHCSICRAVRPTATEVADAYEGTVGFREIDTTRHPDVATSYDIRGVPTIIAIHEGDVVGRQVGARSRQDIERLFESASDGVPTRQTISPTDRVLRLAVAAVFAGAAVVLDQPILWIFAVGAGAFAMWDLVRSSDRARID